MDAGVQGAHTVTADVCEKALTKMRILFTVMIPEALGPLTLGLTYILVALVDATAVAGVVGGGRHLAAAAGRTDHVLPAGPGLVRPDRQDPHRRGCFLGSPRPVSHRLDLRRFGHRHHR